MSRVAIVGAGPSGLAQLHAFEEARRNGADVPEIVCFEKQSEWGGLWNYTWRTGLDQHGDPVHGSMYRYLWSNGPKECLEFADYTFDEHFGKPIPSFPPREVLFDYITGRAKKSNLRQYIQFDSAVRWISFDAASDTFGVTVESHTDGSTRTEEFDHVIVSTGHFSTPNMPEYPGFAAFPGRILHSHDFRDAGEFAGKDVLILGSSYSAEDIALQSLKYGARSITVAYRNAPMGFGWPEGISEVPRLERVEGRTAHFADGSARDVDAIVLCTGYQHHFPFLEDGLRLRTSNNLYPDGLYKGVVWTANPRLMYLAMQDQYYTFTMFDAQAFYVRDVVLGRIPLPTLADMDAEIAGWRTRLETLDGPMDDIDFQTDYLRDLMAVTNYPAFDLDLVRRHFATWEHHKEETITGYRDRSFSSPCTGTVAPLHHTPWWNEPDDSLTTFLGTNLTVSHHDTQFHTKTPGGRVTTAEGSIQKVEKGYENLPSMDKPGCKAFIGDAFANPGGAVICSGFFELFHSEPLVYEYTYDETKFVVEGELVLTDMATGQVVRAAKGDVLFFPKGTTVRFETPDHALGFYAGHRSFAP